jgi:hypothetical protein
MPSKGIPESLEFPLVLQVISIGMKGKHSLGSFNYGGTKNETRGAA